MPFTLRNLRTCIRVAWWDLIVASTLPHHCCCGRVLLLHSFSLVGVAEAKVSPTCLAALPTQQVLLQVGVTWLDLHSRVSIRLPPAGPSFENCEPIAPYWSKGPPSACAAPPARRSGTVKPAKDKLEVPKPAASHVTYRPSRSKLFTDSAVFLKSLGDVLACTGERASVKGCFRRTNSLCSSNSLPSDGLSDDIVFETF